MKRLIAVVFLGLMLTGCANGVIAHENYKKCEGYDEYRKSVMALSSAEVTLIDLNNSYHRAIPEAITVTEGNVSRTFLVNPLDDDIDRVREQVENLTYEVEAFEKKCALYKW